MMCIKAIYPILSRSIRKTRRHDYYYFMSTVVEVIPMEFFVGKFVDSIDIRNEFKRKNIIHTTVAVKTTIKGEDAFLLVGVLSSDIESEIYKSYACIDGEIYKTQSKPPIYFSYLEDIIVKQDEDDFIIDKETTKFFRNSSITSYIIDNEKLKYKINRLPMRQISKHLSSFFFKRGYKYREFISKLYQGLVKRNENMTLYEQHLHYWSDQTLGKLTYYQERLAKQKFSKRFTKSYYETCIKECNKGIKYLDRYIDEVRINKKKKIKYVCVNNIL